jgi:FixJ family two-component response regulator
LTDHDPHRRGIVYVVEDDASMRSAIVRLLRSAGYETRAHGSAAEFLLADIEDAPGCLLLDVILPGLDGIELHSALVKRPRSLPVLFLTGHGDIAMSVQAMKLGAVDFLTKPVERDVLLRAIETALERYAEDRARRTHLEELQSRYRKLTPRERDVFSRIVEGQLNKTVASEWGMSLRTVKAHRAHVMEKLGASSIVDLVRFAAELGLGRE